MIFEVKKYAFSPMPNILVREPRTKAGGRKLPLAILQLQWLHENFYLSF